LLLHFIIHNVLWFGIPEHQSITLLLLLKAELLHLVGVTVAGALLNKQQALEQVVVGVAVMYTHTAVELVILDKVTKAAPEYGRATVKLVAVVAADLLAPDNKVTEMQVVQADPALLY
jgi:hypothetical protein